MMYRFKLPYSKSNYETTLSLDGVEYVFLFHWNERTGHWYYRMSLPDGTSVQGDKKLTTGVINRDAGENTPPGYLVTFNAGKDTDPGLLDLNTSFRWFYIPEDDLS